MNVLFIGDIVGSTGRRAVREVLPELKAKYAPDVVIANAENAAGGRGLTAKIAQELYDAGVHGITMGNHTWGNKDIFEIIDRDPRIVRPVNYTPGVPGRGAAIITSGRHQLGIINVIGRTYMEPADDPFRAVAAVLEKWKGTCKHVLVDFHAEATSEKISMGWFLDGKVSAVLGTHTHVQTRDERILPKGTAYITDTGMVGPLDGVLGMEREAVIGRFLTQMPARFVVAEGNWQFHAVYLELDEEDGKAKKIEAIRIYEEDWMMR